ncbi:MAG: fibrillarin-like rRNA/tRNA 2'-O-methyltransferase [Nanoarchaeota archaeon]|nr:fibrillarin-like rRNA/tRNA 2'-O-methyltransferase [Nanoarchaeota archaeon]MBU1644497.1 fibrillarin-like rRNA/tRNA 2'-O-methyltransferase [Nanoarchaeota archaeon]MBU1976501.1 fibrillarin-like rRNA/tRNA 2'-O-methyltransferase [Nanoarchaeota archaeon]
MSKIKPDKIFEIYHDGKRIYTKSILPGKKHFEERTVKDNNQEYREFDPRRSKLAATIIKGCTNAGIRKGDVVLYLGISHGYTSSFISDMVGKEGLIFGVDPAPRVVRDLTFISKLRNNIIPILADANHPEQYLHRVSQADIVYQDIAQRNQAEIFIKNCNLFLKPGGYGLLAVKARSIDVKRKPKQIFEEIRKILEKEFTVIDYRILEPFEKDHCMIIIKKKSMS